MNSKSLETLKAAIREVVEEVVEEHMGHLSEAVRHHIDESVSRLEATPKKERVNPYLENRVSSVNENHSTREPKNKTKKEFKGDFKDILKNTKPLMPHEK